MSVRSWPASGSGGDSDEDEFEIVDKMSLSFPDPLSSSSAAAAASLAPNDGRASSSSASETETDGYESGDSRRSSIAHSLVSTSFDSQGEYSFMLDAAAPASAPATTAVDNDDDDDEDNQEDTLCKPSPTSSMTIVHEWIKKVDQQHDRPVSKEHGSKRRLLAVINVSIAIALVAIYSSAITTVSKPSIELSSSALATTAQQQQQPVIKALATLHTKDINKFDEPVLVTAAPVIAATAVPMQQEDALERIASKKRKIGIVTGRASKVRKLIEARTAAAARPHVHHLDRIRSSLSTAVIARVNPDNAPSKPKPHQERKRKRRAAVVLSAPARARNKLDRFGQQRKRLGGRADKRANTSNRLVDYYPSLRIGGQLDRLLSKRHTMKQETRRMIDSLSKQQPELAKAMSQAGRLIRKSNERLSEGHKKAHEYKARIVDPALSKAKSRVYRQSHKLFHKGRKHLFDGHKKTQKYKRRLEPEVAKAKRLFDRIGRQAQKQVKAGAQEVKKRLQTNESAMRFIGGQHKHKKKAARGLNKLRRKWSK